MSSNHYALCDRLMTRCRSTLAGVQCIRPQMLSSSASFVRWRCDGSRYCVVGGGGGDSCDRSVLHASSESCVSVAGHGGGKEGRKKERRLERLCLVGAVLSWRSLARCPVQPSLNNSILDWPRSDIKTPCVCWLGRCNKESLMDGRTAERTG